MNRVTDTNLVNRFNTVSPVHHSSDPFKTGVPDSFNTPTSPSKLDSISPAPQEKKKSSNPFKTLGNAFLLGMQISWQFLSTIWNSKTRDDIRYGSD